MGSGEAKRRLKRNLGERRSHPFIENDRWSEQGRGEED